jgi:Putative transmembrane protein.
MYVIYNKITFNVCVITILLYFYLLYCFFIYPVRRADHLCACAIHLSGWQQETLHGCVHVNLFNFQGVQLVQQIRSTYSALFE